MVMQKTEVGPYWRFLGGQQHVKKAGTYLESNRNSMQKRGGVYQPVASPPTSYKEHVNRTKR